MHGFTYRFNMSICASLIYPLDEIVNENEYNTYNVCVMFVS